MKFQRNKKKVGLVVNEYGDIQGLVTVEDILEEIVGDFTTSMSPTLAEEVTPQNDGSVIIDGTANVREINKAFKMCIRDRAVHPELPPLHDARPT